tara:strand:- start:456 stop:1166 length:711 start_codon:yes stop_codon:yes gene_type:complete
MAKPFKKLSAGEQRIAADLLRKELIKPEDESFAERLDTMFSGKIDPSIARHILVDGYEDYEEPTLMGAVGPLIKRNGEQIIELNPGEVGAFHNDNTPETYAHEYRHINYPMKESTNRLMDLYAADSDWGVDSAIRMLADGKKNLNPSDVLDRLDRVLISAKYGAPGKVVEQEMQRRNIDKDKNAIFEESLANQFYKDAENLKEWNSGLAERNKTRKANKEKKPETIADFIRQIWRD